MTDIEIIFAVAIASALAFVIVFIQLYWMFKDLLYLRRFLRKIQALREIDILALEERIDKLEKPKKRVRK